MRMTIAAPAKINLWLRVEPRDGSGYHPLATLFCALDLADTVMLRAHVPAGAPGLETSFAPPLQAMPDLGSDTSNLAVRAADAFVDRCGRAEVAMPQIGLVKRIPAGGGLGGGSSDAGAVLRGMCRMHPRRVSTEDLHDLAAALGSDVPFFVLGTPLAHGAGRGERLTALEPLPPRPVVLVLPDFPVPTADAFRWLDEDRLAHDVHSPADAQAHAQAHAQADAHAPADYLADYPLPGDTGRAALTWQDVADAAANDFEEPVFRRHPVLREIRDELEGRGALPALLAGSGSTVFGVFDDPGAARSAARAMEEALPRCRVMVTGTRTR